MTAKQRKHEEAPFAGIELRQAIVDIGSNTVRAVVYGGSARAPVILWNEKVTARLGEAIAENGLLSERSFELALRGLERFALLFRAFGVEKVDTVATAAVREALNGQEFLEQVRSLGLEPRVLTGEEEGTISAHGVIGAFPGAGGIVADLGGGSLELVRIAKGDTQDAATLPLGTLRLAELRAEKGDETRKAIGQCLKKAGWGKAAGETLYLVGGTFRAMAAYALDRTNYPLSDPHGLSLPADRAKELAETLAKTNPNELSQLKRISAMRSEKLPDAAVLLLALIAKLEPERLVVSAWGLREGIIYKGLPAAEQARDPLLAGVAVFGATRGAPPAMTARLAGWTAGALCKRGRGTERLRLAAITLALSAMRIEPNIRLQQAQEWALHKRWISLLPHERAMIAATIYANGNERELPDTISQLATADDLDDAVGWGLALRLARRLSGFSREYLQATSLTMEDDRLVLHLPESYRPLFAIPNEKDLRLLAEHLKLTYEVRIVPGAS